VWLYHRFSLSFRDVQDLRTERGIAVSHEAARQWCFKFGSSDRKVLEEIAESRLFQNCSKTVPKP